MSIDRLTRPRIRSLAVSLPLIVVLAACGGGSASATPAASPTATPTTRASASASPAPSTNASSSPAAGGVTVSANDASEAEIAAALEANGVPNAARWAKEVAEYRPYPVDPTWGKLRQNLAKYDPDPAVLEQIIATLEP